MTMPQQFGTQNQDGETGLATGIANNDDPNPADPQGHVASYAAMTDTTGGHNAYGNPDVPPDVLIEHAGRFYTALPLNAFEKACATHSRSQTYNLPTSTNPVQVLRKNPGRRKARVRVMFAFGLPLVSTPVFWNHSSSSLQGLANVLRGGSIANAGVGALQGPWSMGDLQFGVILFDWDTKSDLWILSPVADTSVNAVYASVTEFFDA